MTRSDELQSRIVALQQEYKDVLLERRANIMLVAAVALVEIGYRREGVSLPENDFVEMARDVYRASRRMLLEGTKGDA